MKAGLTKALQERQAVKGQLTAHDVAECIGVTWAVLEADVESRLDYPPPDMDLVARAMKDADEGNGRTIDEILNELP
jgi:hypothetical protein